MKKYFSIFVFLLALTLLLVGCSQTTPAESTGAAGGGTNTFRVGYARTDITPTMTVPMGGYSDGRLSTGVKDPLYATAIAFSDEDDNTLVMVALDLTRSYSEIIPAVRMYVSEKTGLPLDNILTSASHTHSGPDLSLTNNENIKQYNEALKDKVLSVVNEALADRKSAEMYTSYIRGEGLNFTRHYLLDSGDYAGNRSDFSVGEIIGHIGVADNLLQLVKFTREGGKDVLLANWQAHYRDGKDTVFTSDYFGVMRTELESRLDCQFAYFAGAGGDTISNSKIPGEIKTKDYISHGKALSDLAVEAAKNFKKAETGKVQVLKSVYPTPMKSNPKVTMDVTLYAFSLGDVAFACAPYEMFGINGLTIKENSDFQMTFVATQCNMHLFYVPAEYGFSYDSYEGGVSRLAKGSGEALAEEFGKMLDELHEKTGLEADKKADDYFFKLPEPATDDVLYLNLKPGDLTAYEETSSGALLIHLMGTKGIHRIVVENEELVKKILAESMVKLVFNYSGLVTDVMSAEDMGLNVHNDPATVTSISGSTVTLTAADGTVITAEMDADHLALDVRNSGTAETSLQTNDVVTWFANKDGKITYFFISDRNLTKQMCAHCEQEVEWTQWYRGNSLPSNPKGHYILMADVTLEKEYTIGASADLVLDLNGHTVTGAADLRTIIVKGDFSLMDSSAEATGKIVALGHASEAGRCVFVSSGVFNLYSGTLDGSKATNVSNGCTLQCAAGSGTVNMYGGTIIGGRTESSSSAGGNGGAVSVAHIMNMYGGLITGGEAIGYKDGGTITRGGNGGAVYVASTGTFTMYDGRIEGGKAEDTGDNIYIGSVGDTVGTFIHLGGTVEGE